MTELKPCPFCGCEETRAIKDDLWHYGQCDDCGAKGSRCFSREEAIEAWNRRASPWRDAYNDFPPHDKEVLMYLPDTKMGTHFLAGEYQSEHKCEDCDLVIDEDWRGTADGLEYEPTHWMPTPEPPGEEMP